MEDAIALRRIVRIIENRILLDNSAVIRIIGGALREFMRLQVEAAPNLVRTPRPSGCSR